MKKTKQDKRRVIKEFFRIIFSNKFITAWLGLMFWGTIIHFIDNFSAGILIGFIATLLAFFYARDNLK